jgi:hypothetical protein
LILQEINPSRTGGRGVQERAMRKAVLGSIAALTAGAGWAAGQAPRVPSVGMPPPAAVAPANSGVIPASAEMGMVGDGGPMAAPGGPLMAGPGCGDSCAPGGVYPNYPSIMDHSAKLAPKFVLDARYMLFFSRSLNVPGPFVTTSAPVDGGLIGAPTTQVLHSNGEIGLGISNGFNIIGTLWKDPDRRYAVELGGLYLQNREINFRTESDANGQPLIARPYTEAGVGAPNALLVAFPTAFAGSMEVSTKSQLWGGEGNFVTNLYRSCPGDLCAINYNTLIGFRFWELDESMTFTQSTRLLPGIAAPFNQTLVNGPATIGVSDRIRTLNQFFGGHVGLQLDIRYGKAFVGMQGKIGLGVMHQQLDIDGASSLITGANAAVVRGGLYANAQNIGRFRNDEFAVVPEATGTLGYNWTSWFTTTLGYSFVYMNNVIRPGEQFTTTVNSSLVPTSAAYGGGGVVPVANPAFTQTQYWAQGVQFGFIFRW